MPSTFSGENLMMRSLMICAGVLILSTFAAAQSTAPAQPPAKPEWTAADQALTKEALAAYEAIKPAMLSIDLPALAAGLADNGAPMVVRAGGGEKGLAKVLQDFKRDEFIKDLEKTRDVVKKIDALKPRPGPATTMQTVARKIEVTMVKIPLLGSKPAAEGMKVGGGSETTDADGNFAVLMVKHDGKWYWNPFGW
jgi:hypothetical protein